MVNGARLAIAGALATTTAILSACAAGSHAAPKTAVINHVVFFKLVDPGDASALIADCDALLRPMPMVRTYWAGTHFDMGRTNVESGYDVGAYVGFDSAEDYEAYLVHPSHVEIVSKWRQKLQWYRVYDVIDDRP